MEHDQYLVRRSSLKFREQPEQWNIWKGSLVFPNGIFQQRFVFHFFKAIFDTLWWPESVTAKPKTSRQKQKHHGKTKNLTAKPKISRQNQILHSKNKIALVLPWVFAFPISGNAFDGKRREKRGWPNTCSIGWQLCRFCHGLFPGPAHADVLTRRTGKRDEVHVCLRG